MRAKQRLTKDNKRQVLLQRRLSTCWQFQTKRRIKIKTLSTNWNKS